MIVSIGIRTNIDDSGRSRVDGVDICVEGRTDVLNLSHSWVANKESKCNERGSTYGVASTEGGFEKVRGCTNDWFEEIGSCIDARFEKIGDYTDHGNKEVEDCNDADTNKVMGWRLIYLHPPRDANRLKQVAIEQLSIELVAYLFHVIQMGYDNPPK